MYGLILYAATDVKNEHISSLSVLIGFAVFSPPFKCISKSILWLRFTFGVYFNRVQFIVPQTHLTLFSFMLTICVSLQHMLQHISWIHVLFLKPVFALIIASFPLHHFFFGSQVEILYCVLECRSELTRVEVQELDTLPMKSGRPIWNRFVARLCCLENSLYFAG